VLVVRGSRPGDLVIHGLGGALPVDPHGAVELALPAAPPGAYALHFHDADGGHHELGQLVLR
jgi:hypothetical protein